MNKAFALLLALVFTAALVTDVEAKGGRGGRGGRGAGGKGTLGTEYYKGPTEPCFGGIMLCRKPQAKVCGHFYCPAEKVKR